MDAEYDFLGLGPQRMQSLIEPVAVARYGAEVVGVVEYPQVFRPHPSPGAAPTPLPDLYVAQEELHDRKERGGELICRWLGVYDLRRTIN
mmetsp:Transcript_34290/g.61466  ORF Transcript_34290/g.61466 Transcript_34290/m.61466 type:complete len:90 (-) Transcript_34290:6-275(-)